MRAEIISIGTELLLGQIANSNAKYLGEECASLGINVYFQTVVGDNLNRIKEAFQIAKNRANLIICTGGLGPTQDDITKDALGEFTNRKLTIHQPTLEKIRGFFTASGSQMVKSNERQAHLLEGAYPLTNEVGLAIGLALTDNGTNYILLPGPPGELKPMFERYVIPWLNSLIPENTSLFSKTLRYAGIIESELENRLSEIIEKQQDPTIALYAKVGEVSVRLTTRASSKEKAKSKIDEVEQKIRERTAEFIYADEDISIELAIYKLLKEKGVTLSVVESCTGGLLSHLITSIPGSSSVFQGGVVCYTNELKHKFSDIPLNMLNEKGSPGAVSAETAELLASNVRKSTNSDYCLSITGVAGPAESEGKPVGLVYIGLAVRGQVTKVINVHFPGNRNIVQLRAAKYALFFLYQSLLK